MGSTQDWIQRAREGQDVASCLAHAESAVCRPDDWIALASAWMDLAEVASARRCIETALDQARGEHWPSRRAAEFLLKRLEDREAAVAALGRIESRLSFPPQGSRPTRAYEWVLLARAYQEVLDQRDSVHRCLTSAAAGASHPEDLTALARGYSELCGDLERARDLVERAERLALEHGDFRGLWGVAGGWKEALHDDARARATLEIATTRATDISTLTALAIAWQSLLSDEQALRGALVRGETLARSPDDWLNLAEGYRDGGQDERESTWDPEGVRRCLEAALTADPAQSAHSRERIAVAFRRWLEDSARAAEIVPTMRSIESKMRPRRRLEGWEARDPHALLNRLRARISPEELEAIAHADYGMSSGKHHQALLEIQSTGTFPLPLDWHPLEVLALTRWGGPETPPVRRAFACTVLILDAVQPDSYPELGSFEDTLVCLLESVWALGLDDELEQLLVWLGEVTDEEEYDYAWTLLALVLTRARRAVGDSRLGPLVAALQTLENTDSDLGMILREANSRVRDQWRALLDGWLEPTRGLPPHLEWLAIHLR